MFSSSSSSSDPYAVQRRRLLFRANHRGMKEMDIILGSYAQQYIAGMTPDQLDQFAKILELNDQILLDWCLGRSEPAVEQRTPLLESILTYQISTQI